MGESLIRKLPTGTVSRCSRDVARRHGRDLVDTISRLKGTEWPL